MAKLNLDENEIKRLYVEKKKLIKEIAEIMNCDRVNYVLHISQKSRLDFERLIFPYMVPSMYYKLKFLDILKAESVG